MKGYCIKHKNGYLHTDSKCYMAFISMRGCQPKIYRTLNGAERKAQSLRDRGLEDVSVMELS